MRNKLLAAYGIDAARLRAVARGDGELWRVRPRGGGPDLALRIYAAERADASAVDAELAWLQALVDAGLHVPAPAGVRCAWTHTDGSTRHAALLRWLPGRHLVHALTPRRMRELGGFVARMHAVSRACLLQTKQRAYLTDPVSWLDGRGADRLGADARAAVRDAAQRLHDERASVGDDGFVHGDLHLWNLLFDGGCAGAIDFAECGHGAWALDLAALLQYVAHPLAGFRDHRGRLPALRGALLDGYAAVRTPPPRFGQQIDLLIAWRMLGTLEWVLESWAAPDERPWGPAFLADVPRLFRAFADA